MASKKSGSAQEQPKTDGAENAPTLTNLVAIVQGKRNVGKADIRSFNATLEVPVLVNGKVDELILRTAVRCASNPGNPVTYIEIRNTDGDVLLTGTSQDTDGMSWEFTAADGTIHTESVKKDPKRWYRASVRGIIAGIRILAPAAKGGGGRTVAPLDPKVEKYIEDLDPATQKAIGSYIRRQAKKGSKVTVQDENAMPSLEARRATETE